MSQITLLILNKALNLHVSNRHACMDFKSNDICACVANLNRNCPHTYIYRKLGTLAMYQCWDKMFR